MKKLALVLFVGWMGVHSTAQASLVDQVLDLLARNEFTMKDDRFNGRWQDSNHWRGTFCNGYWAYQGDLWGRIEDLQFDMNEDESVSVKADLRSLGGSLRGQYQAWQSACLPVGSSLHVGVPWADIRAKVWFLENDGQMKVKIRITRTALGKIETYSSWVPDWLEEMGTKLLNKGLEKVWQSQLGEKISKRIGEFLEKKVPADQLPF